jgi:hypothetical protein
MSADRIRKGRGCGGDYNREVNQERHLLFGLIDVTSADQVPNRKPWTTMGKQNVSRCLPLAIPDSIGEMTGNRSG